MNLKLLSRKTIMVGTLTLGILIGGTSALASKNSTIDLSSPQVQQELEQDLKNIEILKKKEINKQELKKELKELEKTNPEKYKAVTESQVQTMSSGKMGTIGDILVTYDNKHSGWNHGHAAIVRENNNYIVEAMPSSGVRNQPNTWASDYDSKKKFYVKGATYSNYYNAQSYAFSKIGYDYDILAAKDNPWRFYCSSLVWQSWVSQGYNLDTNGGTYVTPADIEYHSLTIEY